MEALELFVATAILAGFGYSVFRWFLSDDERLNSELFG